MKKILINMTIVFLTILFLLNLLGCNNKVKKVSISKTFDETIEEKLNNIVNYYSSEVTQPSNPPYDLRNIENNQDYKYIVSQEKNSVNYMLNKFTSSSENGLKEYVMAIACSEILGENSAIKNWSSGMEWYNGYSFNELLNRLSDKGVTKEMLTHLFNTGLTEEEIAELSKEEIDRLCAPGTSFDGMGFDPSKEQIEELKKVGIDVQMSTILYNLGYTYEDMKNLTSNEIDFIFPNTELIENISKKGINMDRINFMLSGGKTYKDIISDALRVGKTNDVAISLGQSVKFSEKELEDAVNCVKEKFKDFKGCSLKKLWYDETTSNNFLERNYKNSIETVNGVIRAENIIILLSNFDVDSSGGDGSLNANSTYSKWNWILIRHSKTSKWQVYDWGF